MSFGKWLKKHVKQAEHFTKQVGNVAKQMNPMGGQGGGMGGMFGMGGQQQQQQPTIIQMGGNADDQARSDAAVAMKRQAGGGQISFTGDGSTPASQAE